MLRKIKQQKCKMSREWKNVKYYGKDYLCWEIYMAIFLKTLTRMGPFTSLKVTNAWLPLALFVTGPAGKPRTEGPGGPGGCKYCECPVVVGDNK